MLKSSFFIPQWVALLALLSFLLCLVIGCKKEQDISPDISGEWKSTVNTLPAFKYIKLDENRFKFRTLTADSSTFTGYYRVASDTISLSIDKDDFMYPFKCLADAMVVLVFDGKPLKKPPFSKLEVIGLSIEKYPFDSLGRNYLVLKHRTQDGAKVSVTYHKEK